MSWRSRFLFLACVAGVALATLAFDALVFGRLAFAPENRTSWDSHPWYNFEMQYRRLLAEREADDPDAPYVLIVGSSIAKYSVQPALLEAELRDQPGQNNLPDVQVGVFSHAAMLPTDLAYYADRIRRLRPSLVVYLTGPADLDLERYAPVHEIVGVGGAREPSLAGYDQSAASRFVAHRQPVEVFYPGAFAARESDETDLSLERRLGFYFKDWFYALRFQDSWRDPFAFNLKTGYTGAADRPVQSYLNYQGVALPEGLWREGHSVAQFSFRAGDLPRDLDEPGLRLEIPGELAGVPGFHLKIYRSNSDEPAAASLEFLREYAPPKAGWQTVPLPEARESDSVFTIQLSHVRTIAPQPGTAPILSVREAAIAPAVLAGRRDRSKLSGANPLRFAPQLTVGRGVRLPGNFGRERLPVGEAYLRRPAWEDWRLERMSDADYRADFDWRIAAADWRSPGRIAFRQLNQIRLAKYWTNWYRFDPAMRQVQDLHRLHAQLARSDGANPGGISLLIVNNPENPLTLAAYDDNQWYRDYLAHFRRFAKRAPQLRGDGERARFFFADHRAALPMQHFLDTHHLSYPGLERMNAIYAAEIQRALRSTFAN